jgi:hypothetical protein
MFDDEAVSKIESAISMPVFRSYPVVSYKYGI